MKAEYLINNLTLEVDFFLQKKISPKEFVKKIYFFIDHAPDDVSKEVLAKLEELNEVASKFEPNNKIRESEPIYLGEKDLREKAKEVLVFLAKKNKG